MFLSSFGVAWTNKNTLNFQVLVTFKVVSYVFNCSIANHLRIVFYKSVAARWESKAFKLLIDPFSILRELNIHYRNVLRTTFNSADNDSRLIVFLLDYFFDFFLSTSFTQSTLQNSRLQVAFCREQNFWMYQRSIALKN